MESTRSAVKTCYTKTGLVRYEIEVAHKGLNKFQVVRGDDDEVVARKAAAKMDQWDEMWAKREAVRKQREAREKAAEAIADKKAEAEKETQEATAELRRLEQVLQHTLNVHDAVDWEKLKVKGAYSEPQPAEAEPPDPPGEPYIPNEPKKSDLLYQPQLGLLDHLIKSRREAKGEKCRKRFQREHKEWTAQRDRLRESHEKKIEEHKMALADLKEAHRAATGEWEQRKAQYEKERDEKNLAVDRKKKKYEEKDPEAIKDYCDLVLGNSEYPDYFPQSYDIEYNPNNEVLVVEYQLPAIDNLPIVKEVKYVQSRDDYSKKELSKAEQNRRYDGVIYEVALRTVHELYEADVVEALESIVFNGFVHSIDPATGQEVQPCILSVQANREEFMQINLENIDPRACFRKLKGIAGAKLHALAPVAPVLKIDREDARFVEGEEVIEGLVEGENLAAMDWGDFEHLIRELFEKEFGQEGGEVKVTRASRDGGIDAVVFDPDPLRGGKIVIQAKRYTNTVGVSAVRDLYGTLLNEGANKGILVSTADYGPDAYEFAKGKPIVLISGGNLLHLLERHGYKGRIDLNEAKLLIAEKERASKS